MSVHGGTVKLCCGPSGIEFAALIAPRLLGAKYRDNFTTSEAPATTHSTMSSSNSNAQISKISGRSLLAPAPAREPVFWRVEGSLLNLTAVRPVGFFAWNSQSF